jgi:hypothetical protein
MRQILAIALLAALTPASGWAQGAAPRAAEGPLAPFAWMDGRWRGEARFLTERGFESFTQTERSGEMLGGRIRVVEGKGYDASGAVAFNAFGIIAPAEGGGYEMRSWTLERAGTFPVEVDGTTVSWEFPAGPGAIVRYEAGLVDGKWVEVGHRLVEGRPPFEIMRMELTRIGDNDWPGAGGVEAK